MFKNKKLILLIGIILIFAPGVVIGSAETNESRLYCVLQSLGILEELRIEIDLTDKQYEMIKDKIKSTLGITELKEGIANVMNPYQKVLFNQWINEISILDDIVYGRRKFSGETAEQVIFQLVNFDSFFGLTLSEMKKQEIKLSDKQVARLKEILKDYKQKMLGLRLKLYKIEVLLNSSQEVPDEKIIKIRKSLLNELMQTKEKMVNAISNLLTDKQKEKFNILKKE